MAPSRNSDQSQEFEFRKAELAHSSAASPASVTTGELSFISTKPRSIRDCRSASLTGDSFSRSPRISRRAQRSAMALSEFEIFEGFCHCHVEMSDAAIRSADGRAKVKLALGPAMLFVGSGWPRYGKHRNFRRLPADGLARRVWLGNEPTLQTRDRAARRHDPDKVRQKVDRCRSRAGKQCEDAVSGI